MELSSYLVSVHRWQSATCPVAKEILSSTSFGQQHFCITRLMEEWLMDFNSMCAVAWRVWLLISFEN